MIGVKSILAIIIGSLFLYTFAMATPYEMAISNGLKWLESIQRKDGSWDDNKNALTSSFETTSIVTKTLSLFGTTTTTYKSAIQWIKAQEVKSSKYLALKIISLSGAGLDTSKEVDLLLSYHNPDGELGHTQDTQAT